MHPLALGTDTHQETGLDAGNISLGLIVTILASMPILGPVGASVCDTALHGSIHGALIVNLVHGDTTVVNSKERGVDVHSLSGSSGCLLCVFLWIFRGVECDCLARPDTPYCADDGGFCVAHGLQYCV